MFHVDEIEGEWLAQHRAVAKFVAIISALLMASYGLVDWLVDPALLAKTWPWRLVGASLCLLTFYVLDHPKLRNWGVLPIAATGMFVTIAVSVIFLGILRNPTIALAGQMQVLMAITVVATLRTAIRTILPTQLLSFNVGLWWIDAPWHTYALANWFMAGACVILLVVSETAYKSFCSRRELEITLQRQATIVQTSDDAIIGKTLEGTVTSWNLGAQRLFGYTAEEMVGKSMQVLFMPDRIAEEQTILDRIVRGETVTHFETVRVCKDGTLKDVSVSISPIRDSSGAVVGASKIARDITEHKRIERALHEKDARFRAAIETTTDGFWAANSAGQLLDTNLAYARMSGYSRAELLSMRIPDLEAVEDAEATAAHIEAIQRNGSATFETVHRRKDGSVWPVEVITTYSPIHGGQFFVFTKDLTERRKVQELTWRQANFDSLTNLPNRALLFDRLAKECAIARRNQAKVALLFADLDGFKQVNDNHGHDAGDHVLKEVARRWLDCVRAADTVARLGGDEFAIVAGGLHTQSDIAALAEKLIAAVATPIPVSNTLSCQIGASIGICIFPTHATEVDALISKADAAMYESKRRGKNTYTFC